MHRYDPCIFHGIISYIFFPLLANNLNEKTGGSRSDGIAGIAGEGGGSNGEARSETGSDDKAQNNESKGGQGITAH